MSSFHSFYQQKIYIAGINSGETEYYYKRNPILNDHNFRVELV